MSEIKSNRVKYYTAFIAVAFAFFAWGFLTCLNDILIPHLKNTFSLNYAQAMLIQMAFFGAYAFFSAPMANLVCRINYTKSLGLGFLAISLGCFSFLPAAYFCSYEMFLTSLMIVALGIVMLQVAANPFASLLGKPETSASRLTLMQGINSSAKAIAPLFGGLFILQAGSHSMGVHEMAMIASRPYVYFSLLFFVIFIVFFRMQFDAIEKNIMPDEQGGANRLLSYGQLLKKKRVFFGCLAVFMYIGADVAVGSFLIIYLKQPKIGHLTAQAAANFVALYWAGYIIGRFAGALLLKRIKVTALLIWHSCAAVLLILISIHSHYNLAIYTMTAVGLCNSIIFPGVFGLAIRQLGENIPRVSGLLCSCICGGALIPFVQGIVADQTSVQFSFYVPMICYFFAIFYAINGYDKSVAID